MFYIVIMNFNVCSVIALQFWCQYLINATKYDTLKAEKVFWLTADDLKVILNHTFPKSRCCSIQISSKTTREEDMLLKLFITAYKNVYFLKKMTYVCTDYLVIVSQDHQIKKSLLSIPTAIATTRILMLIDSKLEEKSALFNTSIYNHANVNIVCRNGSFTLSENYLEHRIFKKISRLKQVERKTGTVNMQARKLQVSAFYNPPLCFLRTLVNKTINGIPARVFLPNKTKEIDGIELHLFLIIAKTLNFTYTVRNPTGRYNHGRKYNDTAWEGGMLGQITRKEVDIAFSGIWINSDNYEFVNLTEPWTLIFIQFLVPRPQSYSSFWALTRPLSPMVWLALVGVLSLESLYVCGKAWIDPLVPKRFRNIIITFTEMMGRMLGTWLPRIAPQIRLQFVLWEMAGFIIVTTYCSSLAASLTNPEFEQRIDTIRQFIEKNLTWGREGTPPHFKEYFDLKDKYAKQMPSRFILETSIWDRVHRIMQGNHAVVGKIVGNVYYPEDGVTNKALEKLRVMKQTSGQFYTCFAVQSWLLDPVNMVIMRLKESGIVLYHMQQVIHRRTGVQLREVFIEHDKFDNHRAVVLEINPLGIGFAMLIFGLVVSSVVFYTELKSDDRNRIVLQFFQDIRTKMQSMKMCNTRKVITNSNKINCVKRKMIYFNVQNRGGSRGHERGGRLSHIAV